jgi:hypothetical protein
MGNRSSRSAADRRQAQHSGGLTYGTARAQWQTEQFESDRGDNSLSEAANRLSLASSLHHIDIFQSSAADETIQFISVHSLKAIPSLTPLGDASQVAV